MTCHGCLKIKVSKFVSVVYYKLQTVHEQSIVQTVHGTKASHRSVMLTDLLLLILAVVKYEVYHYYLCYLVSFLV